MNTEDVLDYQIDLNANTATVATPTNKQFIILSIISFGLYEFWWQFQAWKYLQEKDKIDIMPFWRAFFSIFFLYDLAARIKDKAQANSIYPKYTAGTVWMVYIFLNFMGRAPEPIWLISFFSIWVLLAPFKALNQIMIDKGDRFLQQSFNTGQKVLLAIGGLWWLFYLLAYLDDFGIFNF